MNGQSPASVDTDDLPPTQYLILEVLAARYRTGEATWTFPSRLSHHLRVLAQAGLIGWKSGVVHATALAWLTEAGRRASLMEDYPSPEKRALATIAENVIGVSDPDDVDDGEEVRFGAIRAALVYGQGWWRGGGQDWWRHALAEAKGQAS